MKDWGDLEMRRLEGFLTTVKLRFSGNRPEDLF